MSEIKIKRIYQPIDDSDGFRILVDRLWARGISKEAAELYEWQKEAAPTAGLRKWFDHDPGKFDDFASCFFFGFPVCLQTEPKVWKFHCL